jgi:hypothetical protein
MPCSMRETPGRRNRRGCGRYHRVR